MTLPLVGPLLDNKKILKNKILKILYISLGTCKVRNEIERK